MFCLKHPDLPAALSHPGLPPRRPPDVPPHSGHPAALSSSLQCPLLHSALGTARTSPGGPGFPPSVLEGPMAAGVCHSFLPCSSRPRRELGTQQGLRMNGVSGWVWNGDAAQPGREAHTPQGTDHACAGRGAKRQQSPAAPEVEQIPPLHCDKSYQSPEEELQIYIRIPLSSCCFF